MHTMNKAINVVIFFIVAKYPALPLIGVIEFVQGTVTFRDSSRR